MQWLSTTLMRTLGPVWYPVCNQEVQGAGDDKNMHSRLADEGLFQGPNSL